MTAYTPTSEEILRNFASLHGYMPSGAAEVAQQWVNDVLKGD